MAKFIKIHATYEGKMYERYVNTDKITSIFIEGGHTKLNVDGLIYALYSDQTPQEILQMIDDQPTVDAVPVSLIQSEIDFLRLAADGEMELNGGYRGETSTELLALEHLLSVWENEKRKQNV